MLPQVFLTNSSNQPTLVTTYAIPSGSSYDWTTLPPRWSNGNKVQWGEQIGSGGLDGIAVLGINQSNQAKDDTETFFAGALLGLAGAALLSAVQEALHAND